MAQIIKCSIDLNKIDKSKIKTVQLKKGGEGKFLDLIMFIRDEQDEYGNICSVALGQSQEEKDKATPKIYIGNGKRTWASEPGDKPESKATEQSTDTNDDLPF